MLVVLLAIDPSYEWYLSGSPSHKSLYIYAKAPTINPDTLTQIKTLATQNGFDAARITSSPQDSVAAQGIPSVANISAKNQ